MKEKLTKLLAQRKKTGQSAGGGLHVLVTTHESGRTTASRIEPKKLQKGRRLHGCVHHVGGSSKASLTLARRERVRQEHSRSVQDNGKCACHVKDWKRRVLTCGSA